MTTAQHHEEQRLARAAAQGDADAWDEIIDLYGLKIYNLALGFASNREHAEDLTQEIFLRLFQALDRYPGDRPLVAWALRLSRNLCIDRYRQARQERESVFAPAAALSVLPSLDDPQEDLLLREQRTLVRQGLAALRPELAWVVELRDLRGLSYEEIGALLELPEGTVKSRINRGRRELISHLRAALAKQPGEINAALEARTC